jgi:hypothetical protein
MSTGENKVSKKLVFGYQWVRERQQQGAGGLQWVRERVFVLSNMFVTKMILRVCFAVCAYSVIVWLALHYVLATRWQLDIGNGFHDIHDGFIAAN